MTGQWPPSRSRVLFPFSFLRPAYIKANVTRESERHARSATGENNLTGRCSCRNADTRETQSTAVGTTATTDRRPQHNNNNIIIHIDTLTHARTHTRTNARDVHTHTHTHTRNLRTYTQAHTVHRRTGPTTAAAAVMRAGVVFFTVYNGWPVLIFPFGSAAPDNE